MSGIDELIAQHCPDGVEYKKLGSVLLRRKGTGITAGKMAELHKEGAPVRVFAAGSTVADLEYGDLPEKSVITEPGIIVKSRGYIGFEYYEKPYSHKSEMWSYIANDPNVVLKYVYYHLQTQTEALQFLARSKSVKLPQLATGDTDNLEIPVPPIEVQQEIVRVLDELSSYEDELVAKLQEELEARERQHEAYREALMCFDEGTEIKELSEIASYARKKVPSTEVAKGCYVGVNELLQGFRGRSCEVRIPIEERCTAFRPGDVLLGNIRPYLKKMWLADCDGGTNGDVLVIRVNDTAAVTPEFLYHVLASRAFVEYNIQHSKGAKMPRGDKGAILKAMIPMPPIETQCEIVAKLDAYTEAHEALIANLREEIELRRVQYEYYRDALLSFEKKGA